jgi:hypothetical protein
MNQYMPAISWSVQKKILIKLVVFQKKKKAPCGEGAGRRLLASLVPHVFRSFIIYLLIAAAGP